MDATARFTTQAAAYNAGRPVYPSESIDLVFAGLAEPARLRIADLGAGTGISTRFLAERGAAVLAVEPNAAMREKAGPMSGVTWLDARAEATGLPGAGVDIVTAFQAFHWFERPAIFAEMQRIARPAGRAVAVYYERDEHDPFTAEFGGIVRTYALDATEQLRADALAAFEGWSGWAAVERHDLPSDHVVDRQGFHDRVRSSSYLPQKGPAHDAMHADLDRLYEARAVDGRVRMALTTTVVVATFK
jgi:SAM-dependent methyltransferase